MPDLSNDIPHFADLLKSMASSNPLGAVARPADPYSPCWCGSGKKWKFCHRDREKLAPLAFGQQQATMLAPFRVGPCLHPEASPETCSGPSAIGSHTVQRRGGLAAIAEGGHVLSTKQGFVQINKTDGKVIPSRIGVGGASTFPGFCSRHDATMFAPLEGGDAVLDADNMLLLSFRAICYELAAKVAALADRSRARDESDRGMPFERQVMVQTHLYYLYQGIIAATERVTRWKREYSHAYLTGDLSSFRYYGITFDVVLPFAAAGAFMPEYDFNGKPVQSLDGLGAEHLCINVTVLNGTTVAVFGWTGLADGPASRFVASFASVPAEQKADALLFLVFEHLENLYLRPSWWDGLTGEASAVLDSKIRSGAGVQARQADALIAPDLQILSATVTEILATR